MGKTGTNKETIYVHVFNFKIHDTSRTMVH